MTAYQTIDAAPTPPPTRLGRYQLLGKLATGGMGEIHLARLVGDGGFERLCVVKRLLPELVASEQFVAMFLDEARIAARLSHPNVCEVHELGRDGNDYYLAMPYLEGVAFGDLIARPREADRAHELRLASGLVAQACEGLHHAHELRGADGAPLGLVHRDVSPSNLFVTTDGVVKVLDFGIAKVRGATARTELGTIKGKYGYMSPEQVRGDELDRRSDVWALGVVLFELATHQRLFKRPSDYLAAKAILEEPIPRADEVDPAIPRPFADVIARALSRERGDRFVTARELGAAVSAVCPPMPAAGIAELVVRDHAEELSAQKTRQQAVLAATVPMRKVRAAPRRWPAIVAAALVAGASLSVWLMLQRNDEGRLGLEVDRTPPEPEVTEGRRDGDQTEARDLDKDRWSPSDLRPSVPPLLLGSGSAKTPAKPGYLSIDSKPWATIYVDGKKLGPTPQLKKPLAAGKHKIRAVTEDGRVQTRTITIRAGRQAPPVILTW